MTEFEQVERYVDGDLEGDELRQFEALLAGCDETRRQVDFQRQLKAVTATALSESAPAELGQAVQNRLADDHYQDLVEGYVDGDLFEDERAFIQSRAEAEPIRSQLDFARQLKAAVAAAGQQEVAPPEVKARLLQALEAAQRPVSFEEAEAVADGEAEFSTDDPESQRRIEFARGLKTAVATAGQAEVCPELVRDRVAGSLPPDEKPQALRPTPSPRGMWSSGWLVAASLVACLLAALSINTRGFVPAELAAAVETDHIRCCKVGVVNAGLDPVELGQRNFGSQPDLASLPPNLKLYDARICPFPDHHQALHVLYEQTDHPGVLVSFYGIPDDGLGRGLSEQDGARLHTHKVQSGPIQVAAWRHAGWVYSLAAEMPKDQFDQLLEGTGYLASLFPILAANR
ncbi:MAG: hypothetical protein AB7S38_42320 [Vulcanimicrobiota bacterium]